MTEWFELVFARSESVAFAGLLMAVGIRTPKLLEAVRPLLGNWLLIDWQGHLAQQDDAWQIGMIPGWGGEGLRSMSRCSSGTAPHRKMLLRDVAIQLLLSDLPTREFLDERRKAWLLQVPKESDATVELLAARFDVTNYSLEDLGDGRIQVNFQWPEHLRERTKRQLEAAQKSRLALTFPRRCRRILNSDDKIPEPDSFWNNFSSLWIGTTARMPSKRS